VAFELGAGGSQLVSARIPVSIVFGGVLPLISGATGGRGDFINGKVGHR
jgi:hypothetical protein